jgi:hypothetical protein
MKTIYQLLSVIALVFTFTNAHAQPFSISSNTYLDTCNGAAYFTVTPNQTHPNLALMTYFGDGNTYLSGISSSGQFKAWHHYTTMGTYPVKHVLLQNGMTPVDSVQYFFSAYMCSVVRLRLYNDLNNNCILDNTDPYPLTS